MAIYHCNIAVTSRSGGHSAVAGAAYLSRSSITNERDGITHNFTRAHRHERLVADLGVTLPEHAPERWLDRSTLWNEVERTERSANAQLCRRIEYALPDELDEASQIALAKRVCEAFAADGMVVDCCVHVGVDGTNAHAHMLMPLRSCDESGFLAKSVNVYHVRDAQGTDADLTASELRAAIDDGRTFEKVYTYRLGTERRELTPSEAEGWSGCERVGKAPVQTTRYLNDWNDKDKAELWRERIADEENAALERAGLDARVSHMSYERQGVDRIPTLHEGPGVKAIEKRAMEEARELGRAYVPVTDIREENIDRARTNGIIEQFGEIARDLVVSIREAVGNVLGQVRTAALEWARGLDRARQQLVEALLGRGRAEQRAVREAYERQNRIRIVAEKVLVPVRAQRLEAARALERERKLEMERAAERQAARIVQNRSLGQRRGR